MPVGYGDVVDLSPRLAHTARVGTIIRRIVCAGQDFVRRCFTSLSTDRMDFSALHDLMREAPIRHKDIFRSAARGGAKTMLGLVVAHHPEICLWRVTEATTKTCDDGIEIVPRKVFASVSGYATRVASMVDTSVYYREYEVPVPPAGVLFD